MMQFTESPTPLPSLLHHPLYHQATSTTTTTTTIDSIFPLAVMNKSHLHRIRPFQGDGGGNSFLLPTDPSHQYSSTTTSSASTSSCTSSSCLRDANCVEQLLVHCANAIESKDATLTHQTLWVLNNIASPDGDSNQRLTTAFLRALVSRAAHSNILSPNTTPTLHPQNPSSYSNNNISNSVLQDPHSSSTITNSITLTHQFSILELANFVDLTPWYRFGFTAANAAILEAIERFSVVNLVDLSTTHCMQIPTLIDAIASRYQRGKGSDHEGCRQLLPLIKLTMAKVTANHDGGQMMIPPMINPFSYDELGMKLVNFAKSRNIALEFQAIESTPSDGFSTLIDHIRLQRQFTAANLHHTGVVLPDEAWIVNCQMMLHYIPDETLSTVTPQPASTLSMRSMFLKALRGLNPTMVVVVDEDADFTSNNLVCRLRSAFNYFWIPLDTVDTFLARGSEQRRWYEAEICSKVENLVAYEGVKRVERQESRSRWARRMRNAGFKGVGLGGDQLDGMVAMNVVGEVKVMLEEHAAGWGAKKEEDDIVLTWKGHNVVFATAWMPC